MTHSVDLFWSFRSPYSYIVVPKLLELERDWDATVRVRPVLPIAVRQPEFFAHADELERLPGDMPDGERRAPARDRSQQRRRVRDFLLGVGRRRRRVRRWGGRRGAVRRRGGRRGGRRRRGPGFLRCGGRRRRRLPRHGPPGVVPPGRLALVLASAARKEKWQ